MKHMNQKVDLGDFKEAEELVVNNEEIHVVKAVSAFLREETERARRLLPRFRQCCEQHLISDHLQFLQPNTPCPAPEILARHCDTLLRRTGNTVNSELDEQLGRAVAVFKYLDDKEFYARMLAKRLIFQHSLSMEAEEAMIGRLKQCCGCEFTSKFHRLFEDAHPPTPGSASFSVQVLGIHIKLDKMQHVTVTVTDGSSNEPSIIVPASMLAGLAGGGSGSESVVYRANSNLVELGKRLLASAELGDTAEVRLLMGRGAPFATDWLGTSPLHAAAANGHLETCELLLRAGISRDARTKVDRTPLHVAAQEGHAGIVELLLGAGADVDAKDMLRMTPLHWAVEREHVECVRLLLQHGASPHHVSKFDKTPVSMALDANRHDILELLETSVVAAATASATLEATESLALVLGNVPVPAHQEEVQTSSQKVHPEEPSPPKLHLQEPVKVTEHVTAEEKVPEVKVEETVVDGDSQSTLRLLRAHGIHILPTEEQTLVASALQSGHTVVLTEAGKLALNLTGSVQADGSAGPAGIPQGRKKVITIRATPSQQRLFRSPTEKSAAPTQPRAPLAFVPRPGRPPGSAVTYSPDVLKCAAAPVVVSSAPSTVGVAVVSPTVVTASSSSPPATKVFVRSPPTTKVLVNGSGGGGGAQAADLATIKLQLEEARREAQAYKLLLSRKEREAELYRRQLQSIAQQSQ